MSAPSTPPTPKTEMLTFDDSDEAEDNGVAASIHAPPTPLLTKGLVHELATPVSIANEGYPGRHRSPLTGLHFSRKVATGPRATDPPIKGTKRPRTHSTLEADDTSPSSPSPSNNAPNDGDQAMEDAVDTPGGVDDDDPDPAHYSTPQPHQRYELQSAIGADDAAAATTLDLTGFTPAPDGGFPKIHGWNSVNVFEGLRDDLRQMWIDAPGPKFFVYPFAQGKFEEPMVPVSMFRAALTSVFPGTNAKVGPPVQSEEPRARVPICFMVGGLDQTQVDAALEHRCFAYPPFAFLAIPFQPRITDYACSLEQFTFGRDEDQEVLSLIRSKIMSSKTIPPFLVKHNDALEQRQYRNANEVLAVIAETVYVKPLEMGIAGGGSRMVWNVYVKSPTQDIAAHAEWVKIIASMNYLTPYNGAGRPLSFLPCLKCRSIDHPTGLCPYPNINGWLGPKDKPKVQPTTAGHAQSDTVGFSVPTPLMGDAGPVRGNYTPPSTFAPHVRNTGYAGDTTGMGYNNEDGYGRGRVRGARNGRGRVSIPRGYYTPI